MEIAYRHGQIHLRLQLRNPLLMLLVSTSPHICSGACGSHNFNSPLCATTPVFSPKSRVELKSAVDAYLQLCRQGDYSNSPHGPIGEWDVSRVTSMDGMFRDAESFDQKLCGDAWVNSIASKTDMFAGSSGSISRTPCTNTAFSPQSKTELGSAINKCE